MKIFICSDIHGSLYYCQKMIDIFTAQKGDKLIILGDILYHGPRNPLPQDYDPLQVSELLNKYQDKIVWIKGNCDSEVDEMVLAFKAYRKKIIPYKHHRLILTHGHIFTENNYQLKPNDILLYGHFHVHFLKKENNIIIGNPGSISLPKENTTNSYMLIDDTQIKILDFNNKVIAILNL